MKKYLIALFMIILAVGGYQQTVHADATYDAIKKRGYISIGMSPDYAPYEFRQTINGKEQVVGFEVSIAKQIAQDLGVKLKIKEMNFDTLLMALSTKKIDLIISGMSVTAERKKAVDFSKPYLHVKQVVVINKSDQAKYHEAHDFKHKVIGAQKATTQSDIAHAQFFGTQVTDLDKFTDLILQLEYHKVAGIVAEAPVANAYVAHDKQLAIIDPHLTDPNNGVAFAMAKNTPALRTSVNQTIDKFTTDGSLQKWEKLAQSQMFTTQNFWSQYGGYFEIGLWWTIIIALTGLLFSTVIGWLLVSVKRIDSRNWLKLSCKWLAVGYVELIRGTPLMVQMYVVFFGSAMLNLQIGPFVSGLIALSLNGGAYVSEIMRAGINSVDQGQTDAARSLGMSARKTMHVVVFPQAAKNILPALGNEFVNIIKDSSILSVIGVGELMFKTAAVQGASFSPFIPLVIASLMYFGLTFTLSRGLAYFEKRLKYA